MSKNLFFESFLAEIEQIGITFYLDEVDEIDSDEPVLLILDDYADCAIEVDPLLEYMDVYMVFPYYDASKSEREAGRCIEEIECDTELFLLENLFKLSFKKTTPFEVTEWDDGCYMCPGYTARVGLYHVPCDTSIIKSFFAHVTNFYQEYHSYDTPMLRDAVLDTVLEKHNLALRSLPFSLSTKTEFQTVPGNKPNSIKIYPGHEYTLLSDENSTVAISNSHWNLAFEIIHACELYDDTEIWINKNIVTLYSNSMVFELKRHESNVAYLEEMYLENLLSSFEPFASLKMKQIINSSIENPLSEFMKPIVFTEGHTDWKHIKHAFSRMFSSDEICFEFREYPPDTALGYGELLNMCKSFSKSQNPAPRIMIFDRDVPSIFKEISDTNGYKHWGNRVYSVLLPIPSHRENTPNICIEHYYTNDEITKEFFEAGEYRRLHMGFEFDRFGRAPQINRICHQLNACGPHKINIIDTAVMDATSLSETNYALSKSAFADHIMKESLSETANASFRLLYDVINQIIKDDQTRQKEIARRKARNISSAK